MANQTSFCDILENAIFDAAQHIDLTITIDVRSMKNDIISAKIVTDDSSFKIIFRNGVVAVYKNKEIQGCYFECDHVLTDPASITANFYLGLCDLLPTTEHLPIE